MKSKMLTVLVIVALLQACAYAGTLAVPLIGQEKSNWCWDASSNMILQFYGFTHTQTEVAAWAVGGYNVGNHLSGTTVGPLAAPGTPSPGNYNRKGCGLVLTEWGPIDSTFLNRCLTMDEVEEQIDGERPAMLAVRWINNKGKDVGGHAIVLRGYNGTQISLNDPWPASNDPCVGCAGVNYIVEYDAMFDIDGPTYSGSAAIGNRWSQTLETGRTLDLCFLIDSTGSMYDDIASVKSASLSMIDNLVANYKNLRLAVVDYRDYPVSPYGDSGDWITLVRAAFTEDANVARAAINAISTGGGNDTPEAVFSALVRTMSGSEIGGWRKDAERHIILMGDAPGHDPEPWAGGYSYSDVLAYWLAEPNKIAIDALLTYGYYEDEEASAEFSGLAAATGGTMRSAESGDAGDAMEDIIDEFTETPRSPRGDVASFQPIFTFVPPTESMGPAVKNILLELQIWKENAKDPDKSAWKNYKKVKLAADATSWTPPKPLPIGDYQWRLGYARSSGTFMLPSAESSKIKAATLMEPNWTEFSRVEVEAAAPTPYTPTTSFDSFYTTVADVNYTFSTVVGADKYAMQIWRYCPDDLIWKVWKKLTIKAPTDPNDVVIEVIVKKHVIDTTEYFWQVQSLNFDTPKADVDAWLIDPDGVEK